MNKQKQQIAIMIIIFIAVVFTLFFIILPTTNKPIDKNIDDKARNLNELEGFNQSQQLALSRIKNSYQYQNYNPSNLRLISTQNEIDKDIWSFTYQFEINSTLAPSNIKSIQMQVFVDNGDLKNTTLTEIPYE